MYIFFIVLIFIASLLIVLSVLAQNPKSGMAANFGASNAVMGVRNTADFLEKFTWGLAIAIVVLSLAATMAMPATDIARSKQGAELDKMIESKAAPKGANAFESAPAATTTTAPVATPAADSAQ